MAEFTKDQLEAMDLKGLKAAYTDATGKTTKSPNKKFLINAILDAQEHGAEPDPDQQFADHSLKHAPDEVQQAAAEALEREAEAQDDDDDEEPGLTGDLTAEDIGEVIIETGSNPFEGMTPQEIIEAAKAKGKEQVAKDKLEVEASKTSKQPKASKDDKPKRESDGLTDLDAETLRKLYETEIGRPTGSSNAGYLIWKIREARKGKVKVGPAKLRTKSAVPMKVIPIRIEEDALAAMDDLIGEGKPHKSRMDIFRAAITVWADMAGHEKLSNLIVGIREVEASTDGE